MPSIISSLVDSAIAAASGGTANVDPAGAAAAVSGDDDFENILNSTRQAFRRPPSTSASQDGIVIMHWNNISHCQQCKFTNLTYHREFLRFAAKHRKFDYFVSING